MSRLLAIRDSEVQTPNAFRRCGYRLTLGAESASCRLYQGSAGAAAQEELGGRRRSLPELAQQKVVRGIRRARHAVRTCPEQRFMTAE
jgi:hypothetical protein